MKIRNIAIVSIPVRMIGRLLAWNRRRLAIRDLGTLPDYLLRDLGIERCEIGSRMRNIRRTEREACLPDREGQRPDEYPADDEHGKRVPGHDPAPVSMNRWHWDMQKNDALIHCPEFSLERRWQVTVQTPEASLDELVSAIQENLDLVQGAYSHCLYIRRSGTTRFRNRAGAHGEVEVVVREVPSAEIVLAIPRDGESLGSLESLERAIRCIAWHHVQEEPVISVIGTWGYLAGSGSGRDNPNRYWNREDGDEIHGTAAAS